MRVTQITMQSDDQPRRRLIASGCVPDRAGQPTQIQLHIDIKDLIGATGKSDSDPHRPALPGPALMPGDECDATIVPIVVGRVDHDLLDKLTAQLTGRTPWSERPAHDLSQDFADRDKVRDLILANAIALLSGPGGLASVFAHRHPATSCREHQPAPGRRGGHRHHPSAAAPGSHPEGQALRSTRLPPAALSVPDPPSRPTH
jgi:hypothetical protein